MACIGHSLTDAEMLKSCKSKTHFHGNGILAGARPVGPSHHPLRYNLSWREAFREREVPFAQCFVSEMQLRGGITRGKQTLQTIFTVVWTALRQTLLTVQGAKRKSHSFLCPDRRSMHLELKLILAFSV